MVKYGQSIRKAATSYDINYKTLGRYVKLYRTEGNIDETTIGYIKTSQIFNDELQKLLYEYIVKASQIYHGLTTRNVRELGYTFAKSNGVQVPNSWDANEIAGVDWFEGFMKRHPTLSIQSPESTSLARITNCNEENILTL